jgi:hypothetical protein
VSGEACPWQGAVDESNLHDCQLGPSYEEMYLEETETQAETEEPQVEE